MKKKQQYNNEGKKKIKLEHHSN